MGKSMVCYIMLCYTCNMSDAFEIVIVRELRQSVNQYDENRSLASGCSEIFKMAEDDHESHVLVLLFLFFLLELNYLKVDNQGIQDSKHLKQVLINKLKE